ncbi:hypothetical protein, partial [Pontibacter aydingkolensis]
MVVAKKSSITIIQRYLPTLLVSVFWLWSIMYDIGISMTARVFTGSYVRDNYPDKLPLLPQCES